MVPVRMVKGARHVVIDVIAVRNGFVSARGPVPVVALDGRARTGPRAIHFEPMLVEVARVGRVEMTVMEVVRVIAVADGLVSAFGPVLMGVFIVFATGHARPPLPSSRAGVRRSTVG
jgi:hypothetical protein